jgi:hypothetical protein
MFIQGNVISSDYTVNEIHNVTKHNLKKFKSTYIMHIDRNLKSKYHVLKSCHTVLHSRLTKVLFQLCKMCKCVKIFSEEF